MQTDVQSQSDTATPPKVVLLLQELRAPFFTGAIVPVVLGAALALSHAGIWNWPLFLLCLTGMILIHAGANVVNDYFDHLSGNDEANVDYVRPFTGGSRMIQNGLLTPREVLTLALSCFAAGSAIGLYLTFRCGWPVLVLGLCGVLGGFFYTAPRVFLLARGIGEVVIGLNFGVLPVAGTYFVLAGEFRGDVVLLSLPVAVLIAMILFINQFQDYEADRSVGKRNWVVRLGRRASARVYAVSMVIWAVPIILAVVLQLAPILCLAALLPLLLSLKAIGTAFKYYDSPQELAPANALTIITHLAVGLLLAGALVADHLWL